MKIRIGDIQFTDDPNDPWFGITFNDVYIGDYCPNSIYIHKITGRIKMVETSLFAQLTSGLFVTNQLVHYKFDIIHRKILEKLAKKCFREYNSGNEHKLSFDRVYITMSQQRV